VARASSRSTRSASSTTSDVRRLTSSADSTVWRWAGNPPRKRDDMTERLIPGRGPRLLRSLKRDDDTIDLIDAFDRACLAAGLSRKQVAALMEISPEQLYQMLRQKRPFSLVRLLKLRDDGEGRSFLRAYWPLVGEAMGLPEFSHGLRVADALVLFINHTQKSMAVAELVAGEVQADRGAA
jgi:transcriptional regulator with XRE-family HTH domain